MGLFLRLSRSADGAFFAAVGSSIQFGIRKMPRAGSTPQLSSLANCRSAVTGNFGYADRMLFARRPLRRIFLDFVRRSQGRDAVADALKSDAFAPRREKLGEVELICVVVTLRNFESIMAQLSLRDFGGVMIKFYSAVADAIMAADGDVNEFCGPSLVGHFNVLYRVGEAQIVDGPMAAFRDASASFDPQLGAQVGVGVCRSLAIAGNFGSPHRFAHAAMGPSAICAHHLAEKAGALNLCEEFAGHFSRPQIPQEPWIAVARHWSFWNLAGKTEA
jgi:hypothetical protein